MVNRLLLRLVDLAAAVWTRRAALVEFAGAVCLVVAAAAVSAAAAWLVAGVSLILKSLTITGQARR